METHASNIILDFVPVSAQLLVDLFQSPLHPVLATLDVVHLSHQRVLHPVVHHVNTLTSLPEILYFVIRKKKHEYVRNSYIP